MDTSPAVNPCEAEEDRETGAVLKIVPSPVRPPAPSGRREKAWRRRWVHAPFAAPRHTRISPYSTGYDRPETAQRTIQPRVICSSSSFLHKQWEERIDRKVPSHEGRARMREKGAHPPGGLERKESDCPRSGQPVFAKGTLDRLDRQWIAALVSTRLKLCQR